LRKVQGHWFEAMSTASITNMEAHGPKAQVDQLEETLKDLLSSHWAYADGAFFVPTKYLDQPSRGSLALDDTLAVLVYWDINDYSKFLEGVKDFQYLTKQEEKVKYYGFCLSGAKAICREGYDCAEGFLEHLQNVDGPLKAAMEVADVVRVEVHGPGSEVDKLRQPLSSFPAIFWSYPSDSFCAPAEYADMSDLGAEMMPDLTYSTPGVFHGAGAHLSLPQDYSTPTSLPPTFSMPPTEASAGRSVQCSILPKEVQSCSLM